MCGKPPAARLGGLSRLASLAVRASRCLSAVGHALAARFALRLARQSCSLRCAGWDSLAFARFAREDTARSVLASAPESSTGKRSFPSNRRLAADDSRPLPVPPMLPIRPATAVSWTHILTRVGKNGPGRSIHPGRRKHHSEARSAASVPRARRAGPRKTSQASLPVPGWRTDRSGVSGVERPGAFPSHIPTCPPFQYLKNFSELLPVAARNRQTGTVRAVGSVITITTTRRDKGRLSPTNTTFPEITIVFTLV